MRYKNRFLFILTFVLFVLLLTNWEKYIAPLYMDIQIDSLYVDYLDETYYHIKYFRNDENCVKEVIRFVDSSDKKACWFITNKRGVHIEDQRVYKDMSKTDRLLVEKCDTLSETYSSLLFDMSKHKPVAIERIDGEDISYLKGDFIELNFDVLQSFIKSIPVSIMGSDIPHTYILLNAQGEKKVELSTIADVECCKFKVY